jgi:hypothetical protein
MVAERTCVNLHQPDHPGSPKLRWHSCSTQLMCPVVRVWHINSRIRFNPRVATNCLENCSDPPSPGVLILQRSRIRDTKVLLHRLEPQTPRNCATPRRLATFHQSLSLQPIPGHLQTAKEPIDDLISDSEPCLSPVPSLLPLPERMTPSPGDSTATFARTGFPSLPCTSTDGDLPI